MIKTTRYCDICGREQHKHYDNYYEMFLPNIDGANIIDIIKADICPECAMKLYWKINELKSPNRKCRIEI